jgi:hypothetical protein
VGTQLTLSATASSGLTVSFTSATQSVCTAANGTATFLTPGVCTINANQAGNSNYSSAMQQSQSFFVDAAGSPTIASFTTSSTSVPANTLVTLYFTVTGATSITIDQGVGNVTNESAAFVTPTTLGTVTTL